MAPSRDPAHDRCMSRTVAFISGLVSVIALASCATTKPPPAAPPTLRFQIDEGRNINSFVREGAVAAHLLLRSGTDPRILVAFPAGNSGVGLWFSKSERPLEWTLSRPPVPVSEKDARGRPLHGLEAEVTVDTARLDIHEAVLSSVRVLRDYQALGTLPDGIAVAPSRSQAIASCGTERDWMARQGIGSRSKRSTARKCRRMRSLAATSCD